MYEAELKETYVEAGDAIWIGRISCSNQVFPKMMMPTFFRLSYRSIELKCGSGRQACEKHIYISTARVTTENTC